MARGFLSGVLWGGILSIGVGGVASVLAPPPMPPEVGDAAPGVAQAPLRITDADSGKQGSESDRAPITGQGTAPATAPDPDTLSGIDADTLASAAVPETGAAANLELPTASVDVRSAVPQSDEPVLPNPQALAPMEPQAADELSISTQPAQPPLPLPEGIQGAFDAPAQPIPEAAEAQDAAAILPVDEAEQPIAEVTTDETPAADTPDTPDAPVQDAEAIDPDPAAPEPAIVSVDPPATVTEDQAPEAPITPEAPAVSDTQGASARPAIGTPAVSLTDRNNSGVTVNRRTNTETAQAVTPERAPSGDGVLRIDENPRPITNFSQGFENADRKPLMAIVLIDDGTSPISGNAGIAALRSFPYPLSFAVDSGLADATDRMKLYRKEGFEVLAIVDLPEGATPVDAETTFGVVLSKMTDVVGVLEGTSGGVQGAREVADQVTAILAGSGHGLVTQDKGLNTMPKLARKEGVPADPVFRDFDSKGQTAQVIRRFLDQAAFRAGQEGAVIMLGRLRPDTISALLLWGLQDRAGQVALAPISAVLLRE